ncbi:MAG: sulfite oxidase-like oxidoreductase [Alphaproteobacteria bacterium]|nr:sulfite oxidase-like oxidoreductase [Alphaproteobacteria bacterium]
MADDDGSGFRDKLIRRKEEWAREGRLLTGKPTVAGAGERLPPGQREVKNWPVLDLGVQPDIDRTRWKLTVDGAVRNPFVWDWQSFLAQPQVTMTSNIHCVTGWSRFDNAWTGVHVEHLLSVADPKSEARHCVFHSHDGYTTNVRLDHFADLDVMLAHSWAGEPLTREHGGPVRVVIPKWYFWKSAKWVRRIEFLAADRPGFWEVRGYHNEGDPWNEDRYS